MRYLRNLALGAAAAALISAAAPAMAQGPGGPTGGPMGDRPMMGGPGRMGDGPDQRRDRRDDRTDRLVRFLDANGDGKVSLDEIRGEIGRVFIAADVSGDASLSVDEFRRRGELFMRLRTWSLFDLLDANGDGKLTKEEIEGPSARWFSRYDANKDAALDADEIRAGRPGPRTRDRR
jgi:hypothetical protein